MAGTGDGDCAGVYCSNSGTFTLQGTWKRPDGTLHENAWISLIYKTCAEPVLRSGPIPGHWPDRDFYCADGDLHITRQQTGCDGKYSFTIAGHVLAAGLAPGKIILNPSFDCNANPSDPATFANAYYVINDPSVTQYGCCAAGFLWSFSGSGTAIGHYGTGLSVQDKSAADICGAITSGLAVACESAHTPGVNLIWWTTPLGFTSVPDGGGTGHFCQVANILSGTYTLDLTDASGQAHIRAVLPKDGHFWYVEGVSLTVTDACGNSETVTTAGTIDTYTGMGDCGASVQVWHTDGWAALSVVDWTQITSVTVNSGAPGGCSGGCGPPSGAPADWDRPPSLLSGGPYLTPSVDAFVYPSVDSAALAALCVCSAAVVGVLLPDCSSAAGLRLSADTFESQLAVAWINTSNALMVALHPAPFAFIGSSRDGWEATGTLEAANADDIGLVFQPSGNLYLTYDLSGAKKYRTNKRLGTGAAGDWSAAATPSPAVSRHSASGRGQGRGWRFRALGNGGAGDIEFSYCGDQLGTAWSTPVTVVSATAYGPYCGGAYLSNGYGCLYTKNSDNHIYWLRTGDPDTWSPPGTDTGMTGIVASLIELTHGALVALIWDSGTKRCRAARSRDRGATWEKDTANIAAIPALDIPPVLVQIESIVFAVIVTGDRPWFAASRDAGKTWI